MELSMKQMLWYAVLDKKRSGRESERIRFTIKLYNGHYQAKTTSAIFDSHSQLKHPPTCFVSKSKAVASIANYFHYTVTLMMADKRWSDTL